MRSKVVARKELFSAGLRASERLRRDQVFPGAAQASFFLMTSLVPFLSLLFALTGLFLPENPREIPLPSGLSEEMGDLLRLFAEEIAEPPGLTLLSFHAVLALWTASRGIASVRDSLCRIYDAPAAENALLGRLRAIPTTLAVTAAAAVPALLVLIGTALTGTAGALIRALGTPLTLALLSRAGIPLAGPSANPSGKPSPKTAGEVLAYFDGAIPAVIDGGPCGIGTESTIIDLSRTPYAVVRRGALSEEEIDEALTRSMTVIGLTGGSGSGKTTALEWLERRGALGLDCDEIYHELLRTSEPMLDELRARFPAAFPDGAFDRKALGRIVFSDAAALSELNAITHRYVFEAVRARLREHARNGGFAAVIDAVALIEGGLAPLCTLTVGVTADAETRVRRIMAREGIGEDYARSRIAAQQSDSFFEKNCDRVLRNDGTVEELEEQCRRLFGDPIDL